MLMLPPIVRPRAAAALSQIGCDSPANFSGRTWINIQIAGTARFEEVARTLGAEPEDPEMDVDTIAGYVQAELGRMAGVGDTVRLGSWELKVEEVKRNRILSLSAVRQTPAVQASEGSGPAG